MTKQETIEAIKVMQAYVDGAEINCSERSDLEETQHIRNPQWNWMSFVYVVKPTPKLRPWKVEEVPLDAWYRYVDSKDHYTKITEKQEELVKIFTVWYNTVSLFNHFQYSLDQGKTWLPCGVEE